MQMTWVCRQANKMLCQGVKKYDRKTSFNISSKVHHHCSMAGPAEGTTQMQEPQVTLFVPTWQRSQNLFPEGHCGLPVDGCAADVEGSASGMPG